MTGRVIVLRGDAASLPLPDESVDLIVTSPPYWGQRAYEDDGEVYAGQIGAEETPAEYVAALLACTREWTRVLKPEGSLFVNLGDKYATRYSSLRGEGRRQLRYDDGTRGRSGQNRTSVREKSLLNLPHRYAIGCTDQLGLIERAEVVWAKLNPLPESVQDRVRRSHEILFHFTKSERYFAAVDEIRQPLAAPDRKAGANAMRARSLPGGMAAYRGPNPLGALPGSVWEIASQALAVPGHLDADHFAAFPMDLPRRVILGWSPSGICAECGNGRRPVAEEEPAEVPQWALDQRGLRDGGRSWHGDGSESRRTLGVRASERSRTISGYACACPDASAPVRPAVVLDPFGGTGTTALVAAAYGRTGITVDRSADYCRIAQWRTSDPGERARALGVPKPPPVIDGQRSLFDAPEAS